MAFGAVADGLLGAAAAARRGRSDAAVAVGLEIFLGGIVLAITCGRFAMCKYSIRPCAVACDATMMC